LENKECICVHDKGRWNNIALVTNSLGIEVMI